MHLDENTKIPFKTRHNSQQLQQIEIFRMLLF